nr:hypothetical protein [Lysinibacillus timonensis]
MKNKQHFNKREVQNLNSESQAAQLAVIAGLISTLGDGLATVSAALALQEAQQSNQNGNNNNSNIQLKAMQKQIDDLAKEIREIKKHLRL